MITVEKNLMNKSEICDLNFRVPSWVVVVDVGPGPAPREPMRVQVLGQLCSARPTLQGAGFVSQSGYNETAIIYPSEKPDFTVVNLPKADGLKLIESFCNL